MGQFRTREATRPLATAIVCNQLQRWTPRTPPANGYVCMAYLHQGYVKYECIYVSGYVEYDRAYVVRPARRCIGTQRQTHVRKREANVRCHAPRMQSLAKCGHDPLCNQLQMWTRPGPPTPRRYKHENQD